MEKIYRNNVLWIIFNEKWKILIWKYNTSKPNWTFPKWWIEKDEDFKSAIFREVYEELWINKNNLELSYFYENEFIKNFSQVEIEWKIKNKWEYFVWKKEKIILINYKWDQTDINLNISNEFSEYKFIDILDIPNYINNNDLISFIDLNFLIIKINEINWKKG